MSGETEKDVSGWTVDTLQQHVEQLIALLEISIDRRIKSLQEHNETQFIAQEKAVQLALTEREKAVIKSETATEKRFENVNEFRGALTDLSNLMMPRAESEARHARNAESLAGAVHRIEEVGSTRDGRIAVLEQFQALSTAQQGNIEGRMHQLNQLRTEVTTDRSLFVLREANDQAILTIRQQLADNQVTLGGYMRVDTFNARQSRADAVHETQDHRLSALENWRAKAIGVGSVLVLFSGLVGALVLRALGG